jgi:hypothetical protein
MHSASLIAAIATVIPAAQPAAALDAEITLERTACFGTCPVYSVRITGDGNVEYVGKEYVRVLGPAQSRISRAAVQQLLDLIQKARYFELDGEYRYLIGPDGTRGMVTDLPTTTTSVRIGTKKHRVADYVGAPETLHEVERAIDRTAGTVKWISVDREVLDDLVRDGWKAASEQGLTFLGQAIRRNDVDTVDALLAAGVDPNAPPQGPLFYASDPAVIKVLIDRGADVNAASRSGETILMVAVRMGQADKVRLLLDAGALVTSSNESGETALHVAQALLVSERTARRPPSPFGPEPPRDYARIVQLLLAAGAKDF